MNQGTATLQTLLQQAMTRYGDRTAIVFNGQSVSYRELDVASDRLATGLIHQGVLAGDRVAILLRNCVEYVVAELAINKLNAVIVPLNHLLGSEDVLYILAHSEARVFIAHEDLIPESLPKQLMCIIVPKAGKILCNEAHEVTDHQMSWAQAMSFDPVKPIQRVAKPNSPAALAYTGGTTGRPKGVLHTQAGMGLNMLAHVVGFEVDNGGTVLLSSPLPHSAGYIMKAFLIQGGRVIVTEDFNPAEILEKVQAYSVNTLFMVPTMIYRLLDEPNIDKFDCASLRTVIYGAAPISQKRLKQALDRFGPIFLQIYAQTECPNIGTILKKEDHLNEALQGSCGQPALTTEIRIVDSNGNPLPAGDVGEVQFKSGYLLQEYYKDPEQTDKALQDGWLFSGDIGYQNKTGHLFLVDRSKDMIISGGLNIYSSEVETVIENLSKVNSVAVIGVPHEDWGEAVHAVVVRENSTLCEDTVIQQSKALLAKYKVPKTVEFVESLPLTNYGKVDKKKLRSKYWANSERAIS
jgi:fatty-acyl-CoA synthase